MKGGELDAISSSVSSFISSRPSETYAPAASPWWAETSDRISVLMRCTNPYVTAGHAFGCGQCMPCRFNRRRVWMHRLMLESYCHEFSSFVTLTYSDENLPADGSVSSHDLQLWIKRLRKALDKKIRFFGVGEYGDQTFRPHYHVAVFGMAGCVRGRSDLGVREWGECQCETCSVVRKTWKFGHTQVGTLEVQSARYLCGYTVKKMTCVEDSRLLGRAPEFARMSNRPGIGALALDRVMLEMENWRLLDREVPGGLRHNGHVLPFGTYLKGKLRDRMGHIKEDVRDAKPAVRAYQELREMQKASVRNGTSVRSEFARVNEGYAAKLEGQRKIKERRSI